MDKMKINWKEKLSSRKFWAMVATFITSILVLFSISDDTVTKVTAIITAFGTTTAYILSETSIDKARKENTTQEE
jgi:hypothetical protein